MGEPALGPGIFLVVEQTNLLGARALRTLAEAELDVVTLVHAGAVESRLVEEDIGAAVVLLDESEALEIIEAIDDTRRPAEGWTDRLLPGNHEHRLRWAWRSGWFRAR